MPTERSSIVVQVFGVRKHADVRKALRFFAERRVETHFVDCDVRGPSAGELKRFAARFGIAALIDRRSRRFLERGLGPARYGDATWLEMLVEEPALLVLPLVRCGDDVTLGLNEKTWQQWVADAR